MKNCIKKFLLDTEAQDIVEYALLLTFIALAAIGILPTLGSAVNSIFSSTTSTLKQGTSGS